MGELLDLLLDTLATLLAVELVLLELERLGLPVLDGLLASGLGGKVGVLADLGVGLLVDLLKAIS